MSDAAGKRFVLALDQGTTSSRAILFTHDGRAAAVVQQEFSQILPSPGIVEHDPEAIWNSQLAVAREVMQKAGAGHAMLPQLALQTSAKQQFFGSAIPASLLPTPSCGKAASAHRSAND